MQHKTPPKIRLIDDGELSEPATSEAPTNQQTEAPKPIESQFLSLVIQVSVFCLWIIVGIELLQFQLLIRDYIALYVVLAFAFLLPGYLVAALIDACSRFTRYGEDITARRYYLLSIKALPKNLALIAISSVVDLSQYKGAGHRENREKRAAKR